MTETAETEIARIRDILKQRMKYPGAQEDDAIKAIAKTWVLPTKLHCAPSTLAGLIETIQPIYEKLNLDVNINYLKVELSQGGERQFLYKLLDDNIRPGLILVKWSNDVDNHIPTANCAGHLQNCGYSLCAYNDNYYLYYYSQQILYDLCSWKTISYQNPIMTSILEQIPKDAQ